MTWNSHGIWCGFGPNCHRTKSSCDEKLAGHGISMRILVTFFTGEVGNEEKVKESKIESVLDCTENSESKFIPLKNVT